MGMTNKGAHFYTRWPGEPTQVWRVRERDPCGEPCSLCWNGLSRTYYILQDASEHPDEWKAYYCEKCFKSLEEDSNVH